ncbi:hypothetical protein ACP70R_030352 [Stipagrostis hirtigluma subsp. patula]
MEEEGHMETVVEVSRFHCRDCNRRLKPPTFMCEAGHIVCGSHAQACASAAAYADIDGAVRDAKLPCPNKAGLAEHFRAAHCCAVTDVVFGEEHAIPLPPPGGSHVLVEKGGRRVFLVSTFTDEASTLVSVMRARARGDAAAAAAAGARGFLCSLMVDGALGDIASASFVVRSSGLSGGLVAADPFWFLALSPGMKRDSGDATVLVVCIDKVGPPRHWGEAPADLP